ncbi:hypothetical protein Gpo141_00007916 [Globisporangium polare]
MGCCPSKSRAERDTCCSGVSGEKQDVEATAAVGSADGTFVCGESNEGRASAIQGACNNNQNDATPTTMLMDRGDDALLSKYSDSDPTPSSPPSAAAATALPEITFSGVADYKDSGDNNVYAEADATRAAESTVSAFSASMTPSPARGIPSSSPRKAPVNYEEMPINSMYHRIHTVETEAQDSRRQEELRAEAERREREVREFKASMLTP